MPDTCITPGTSEQFVRGFLAKATRERVPLTGTISLTHRCNLDCVHCYVGPQASARCKRSQEMTSAELLSVFDQANEAGCLNLLLTGGEPLIRADFELVYRHAIKSGFLVTVFTNGILLGDRETGILSDFPPQGVEVSIYGAKAATHERITGVPGSYAGALAGVRRALAKGIRITLKTMLTTVNVSELSEMKQLAADLGVGFRFDAALFPRLNGDKSPLTLRVKEEAAADCESADAKWKRVWSDYFLKRRNTPAGDQLYQCAAGLTSFHVDAYGKLWPCLLSTKPEYSQNLREMPFAQAWLNVSSLMTSRKTSGSYVCSNCEKRFLCGLCPAFGYLEGGHEEYRSHYLCTLGQLRLEAIEGKTDTVTTI